MKKVLSVLVCVFMICPAFATGDATPTSKGYVDAQMATLQDNLPGAVANTVVTTTATAGETGTKAIYDSTGNYAEQQNALVTAEDANTAVQNAVANELICTEYGPDGCWVYSVRSAIQSLLPTGYTALEYLESDGTQYINTGIVPTNSTGLKIKFNKHQTGDQVVVGVDASPNPAGTLYVNPAGSNILLPFAQEWRYASSNPYSLDTDYEVKMNYMNDRKRYINGTATLDITTTLVQPSGQMYLFAGNLYSAPNWYFRGRVYYLQITNESATIQNLIPARHDSDGVLGMYDLISEQFFTNAGTGTFIAGPDLNVYLPSGN